MVITSRKNEKVREFCFLKDKKYREDTGLYLVEGEKSVKEAVAHGGIVTAVLGVEDLVSAYTGSDIDVTVVSKEIADYVSDSVTPQGIVAAVKMGDNRLIAPLSRSILLDGLNDPGNVGTIIRTACACGVKDIYLADSCDAYSPKAVRASMSGIFSVNVRSGSRDEVLRVLKGVPIICADMNGENVFDYDPPEIFCLAIGSEAHGVSDVVRSIAAYTLKIPMKPQMESLNAGVSASIMLYELIKSDFVKKV